MKKKRPWGDDDNSVRNWGKDDLSGNKYFSFTFSFFLFMCGKMMTVIHLLHFYSFFFSLQLLHISLLLQNF